MERETAAGLQRVAVWAGFDVGAREVAHLERLAAWLATEAITAGALAAGDRARIWDRHVLDSLCFSAVPLRASRVLDIGSGAGLPALPLAICHPAVEFVALDRSGRRTDLVERAVALLGLQNVTARQHAAEDVDEPFPGITLRAVTNPETAMRWVRRILSPGGIAVAGLSRSGSGSRPRPPSVPGIESEVVTVPDNVLASAATLLRMTRRVEE